MRTSEPCEGKRVMASRVSVRDFLRRELFGERPFDGDSSSVSNVTRSRNW